MKTDGHIRLLSLHVANKIAAGEVVERPASVVKELVENAIDAGATRVEVAVTAGGRKLISVSDNGVGMGRDDALLSVERQATSKLRDVDDIERINTLGFRGEALPSIASVSRFILKTRRAGEESGTEIIINGGTLQGVQETGLPQGSVVEVRDLFFNVPARRKFLRAYQTEQGHIRSVFILQALAHPELGFSLHADGREVFRVPPDATLEERVCDLFGEEFRADLLPVEKSSGDIHVYGFAGRPGITRNERGEQYIFVNRRPATAPVIVYALREAYPAMAQERRPAALLYIDLPPDQVDVNVHPAKREVRFRRASDVRDAIMAAVGTAVGSRGTQIAGTAIPGDGVKGDQPVVAGGEPSVGAVEQDNNTPVSPIDLPQAFPYPALAGNTVFKVGKSPSVSPEMPVGKGLPLLKVSGENTPWAWCRVVGQIAERYLLVETDEGFVTVDPRAARERVLFEHLMGATSGKCIASQTLLLPECVRLLPADAVRVRRYLKEITSMGFAVAEFGEDSFIVEAIPAILGEVACAALLENIAHDFESAGRQRGSEKWQENVIAKAVCRTAARVNDKLNQEIATQLVEDLAQTRMPYICPRGRPTMIFTAYRELERKFGR